MGVSPLALVSFPPEPLQVVDPKVAISQQPWKSQKFGKTLVTLRVTSYNCLQLQQGLKDRA